MEYDLGKKLEELKRICDEIEILIDKEDEERDSFREKTKLERKEFEEKIAIERKEFEKKISDDEKEFEKAMHTLRKKTRALT